jgi:hypothetical protein|tara:strand:+ start:82 stop:348 length:267 start_codon:yes stop_codon:yes gene_type:complete
MTINWEMIGVVIAFIVVLVSIIQWAITKYTTYLLRETKEELDIKSLHKKVESVEKDVKELAQANVVMVSSFHTEINKILHKMNGGSNE